MYIVTIITTRSAKDTKFFDQSSPEAIKLCAEFNAQYKTAVGYLSTTSFLSANGLVATTVHTWASKAAYNRFMLKIAQLEAELSEKRTAYHTSHNITREKAMASS